MAGLGIKFLLARIYDPSVAEATGNQFFRCYNMFFNFLGSLFLFLAFKNIKITGEKITRVILFFSSTTLYVYILHELPGVKGYMWKEIVHPSAHLGMPSILINYVCGIGGVYLVCTLLGVVIKNVYRLSGMPKLTLKISEILSDAASKFMDRSMISKR